MSNYHDYPIFRFYRQEKWAVEISKRTKTIPTTRRERMDNYQNILKYWNEETTYCHNKESIRNTRVRNKRTITFPPLQP